MELSSSNIKKFLIFSQKKAFFIFQEMKISHISGNKNTEKYPYFSGNKNFLYFKKQKTRSEKMSYISSNENF